MSENNAEISQSPFGNTISRLFVINNLLFKSYNLFGFIQLHSHDIKFEFYYLK